MSQTVYRLEKIMDYIFDIKEDRAQRITSALSMFITLDEDQQDEIIRTIERQCVSLNVVDFLPQGET